MKNKTTIILGGIFVILVVIFLVVVLKEEKKDVELKEKPKYQLVYDYSEFFTMVNCANKYYSYLSMGDVDNLSKLLNGASESADRIAKYKGKSLSFKVSEMYYGNNKYYMKGFVYEELLNASKEIAEEYLCIKVDEKKDLFIVEVINKDIYDEVVNG